MSDHELRRTLNELHRELAEVGEEDLDAATQQLLSTIRGDIEEVLERSAPQGLAGRLEKAVEGFEATHPKLASAMGAVIDQLARLGI